MIRSSRNQGVAVSELLCHVMGSACAHLVHPQRWDLRQVALGIGVFYFSAVVGVVVLLAHGSSHHRVLLESLRGCDPRREILSRSVLGYVGIELVGEFRIQGHLWMGLGAGGLNSVGLLVALASGRSSGGINHLSLDLHLLLIHLGVRILASGVSTLPLGHSVGEEPNSLSFVGLSLVLFIESSV